MPTSNMTNAVWFWRSIIGTLSAAAVAGTIGGISLAQAFTDHDGNHLRHMTVADSSGIKESMSAVSAKQAAAIRDIERIEKRQEKIEAKVDEVQEATQEIKVDLETVKAGNDAILRELRRRPD